VVAVVRAVVRAVTAGPVSFREAAPRGLIEQSSVTGRVCGACHAAGARKIPD
jgi:cytochrome c5